MLKQEIAMRWEVIDINTDEVIGSFRNPHMAAEVRDDLNRPHLDKMYAMREAPRRTIECNGQLAQPGLRERVRRGALHND